MPDASLATREVVIRQKRSTRTPWPLLRERQTLGVSLLLIRGLLYCDDSYFLILHLRKGRQMRWPRLWNLDLQETMITHFRRFVDDFKRAHNLQALRERVALLHHGQALLIIVHKRWPLTRTRTHSLRVLRRVRLHVERFVFDRWQRQSCLDPPSISQPWQQVDVLICFMEFLRCSAFLCLLLFWCGRGRGRPQPLNRALN